MLLTTFDFVFISLSFIFMGEISSAIALRIQLHCIKIKIIFIILRQGTKVDKDLLPEIEIEQELHVFKIFLIEFKNIHLCKEEILKGIEKKYLQK